MHQNKDWLAYQIKSLQKKLKDLENKEGVSNHDELNNLQFDKSGHTGFASSKQINELNDKIDNINVDVIPHISDTKPVDRGNGLWLDTNVDNESTSNEELETVVFNEEEIETPVFNEDME